MRQLRLTRIAHGMRLYDVMRLSGVSQGRLSMIERGIVMPTSRERVHIARVFGGDPEVLFAEVIPSRLGKAEQMAAAG